MQQAQAWALGRSGVGAEGAERAGGREWARGRALQTTGRAGAGRAAGGAQARGARQAGAGRAGRTWPGRAGWLWVVHSAFFWPGSARYFSRVTK